jgi:hemerythrin-like domain-containing protein
LPYKTSFITPRAFRRSGDVRRSAARLPQRISIHSIACWHNGCRAVALRESLTDQEDIMNGLKLLKEDHRKVQELFEQVKMIGNERQRKQLYNKIKVELDTHTYIEEKVLYATLKKYEEFKEMALEAVEEHLQVKNLLREIDRLSEGSERFEPKLMVLIENVNHHIEKEEGEMFPKVEGRFSEGQLKDLGQNLEAAKKEFGKETRARAASSR